MLNNAEYPVGAWGNHMDDKNKFNPTTLHVELQEAGLDIDGCDSTGRVHWKKPPTEEEQTIAETIRQKHDLSKLPPRQEKLERIKEKRRSGVQLNDVEINDVIDFLLRIR